MKNKKLITRILVAILIVIVIAFLTFNENGFSHYLKLKREIQKLDREIAAAELKLSQLEAEIDSLQTSKVKIEQVAREKYDMKNGKETEIKIEEN